MSKEQYYNDPSDYKQPRRGLGCVPAAMLLIAVALACYALIALAGTSGQTIRDNPPVTYQDNSRNIEVNAFNGWFGGWFSGNRINNCGPSDGRGTTQTVCQTGDNAHDYAQDSGNDRGWYIEVEIGE